MKYISLFTWLAPILAIIFLSAGTLAYVISVLRRQRKPNIKHSGIASAILLGIGMLCNFFVTIFLVLMLISLISGK